ncbi:hypothetical protein ANN_23983 [Periplaneta americana]|uniref:Uncharacterized protein n=1 Tax=Periplaneta americana TaxID=6978 RepID=A0ABQ8S298_PERAM|nr:hypothetical protein ANN_23983 [Periplaneta americana]
MSPGSNTESYPAFAHIGLRENPGKNLNEVEGKPWKNFNQLSEHCYYHLVVDERNITVRYYPMSDATQLSPTAIPCPIRYARVFGIRNYRAVRNHSCALQPKSTFMPM